MFTSEHLATLLSVWALASPCRDHYRESGWSLWSRTHPSIWCNKREVNPVLGDSAALLDPKVKTPEDRVLITEDVLSLRIEWHLEKMPADLECSVTSISDTVASDCGESRSVQFTFQPLVAKYRSRQS
jgi:hypothetical protein